MFNLTVNGVKLSGPDEFGFLYGQIPYGETTYNLNVLPPVSLAAHWIGRRRLVDAGPHATEWTLFVEGERAGTGADKNQIEDQLKVFEVTGVIDELIKH